MLLTFPADGTATTPATEDLFKESTDKTLVDQTHFLSMVMSLMAFADSGACLHDADMGVMVSTRSNLWNLVSRWGKIQPIGISYKATLLVNMPE